MLDLLEWQALVDLVSNVLGTMICSAHTASFSTMAVAPNVAEDSKVSIDWSRCIPTSAHSQNFSQVSPYVKSAELLSVGIELLVVEGDELLYAELVISRAENRG